MIKTKKETIEVEKPETIICDRCGKEYEYDGIFCDIMEIQEFLKIDFYGGYGSIFGDMNHVQCDLCQHCLKDLIEPFVRVCEDEGSVLM